MSGEGRKGRGDSVILVEFCRNPQHRAQLSVIARSPQRFHWPPNNSLSLADGLTPSTECQPVHLEAPIDNPVLGMGSAPFTCQVMAVDCLRQPVITNKLRQCRVVIGQGQQVHGSGSGGQDGSRQSA